MEMLIIVVIALVVLDIAALRWGFDSRDGIDSLEWERQVARNTKSLTFPPQHHH